MFPPERGLTKGLAGRYEIEAEIGKGGMAVVYRARDVRHDRHVALKVLRPDLSSSLGGERFLREIQLAARLQHPHILPVHDSGEAGGLLFYVMPFVDGETLRRRLDREGALPINDALRIARDVADALHYAHQRDVVHRDIKPENILLSGEHALVADFGIARAITGAGGLKLTEIGLAVGTPAYMSPEQAAGDARIDARSDIYALGCVLHEMLAGEPPFSGSTPQRVMSRHSVEAARPIRDLRPTVPPSIECAVLKALAKAPADRFATARDFVSALVVPVPAHGQPTARAFPLSGRYAAVGIATLGVVALTAPGLWNKVLRGASDQPVSVAVAPLRMQTTDSADRYLADALAQDITNGLTRVRALAPRPYATVASAAARDSNPLALGRALGVDYVLSVTLRRWNTELRVTSELIRVKDGAAVWSPRRFEGSGGDVFRMGDSITNHLIRELSGRFDRAADSARGKGRRDPEAYALYAKALQVPLISLAGSAQRIELLSQAIAHDSSFADAWAELAAAYSSFGQYSGNPAQTVAQISEALNRAIGLDSLNAQALSERADLKWRLAWDFAAADREFRKAIEAAPSAAWPHATYAKFLFDALVLQDSAAAEIDRAIRLDPNESHFAMITGYFLQERGDLDRADSVLKRALTLNPNDWVVFTVRSWLAERRGQMDVAVREAQQAHRIQGPDDPFSLAALGQTYGRANLRDSARAVLARMKAMAAQRYVAHPWLAMAHVGAGDFDGGIAELRAAANSRDGDLALALHDTRRELGSDPRYLEILRRVGLDTLWLRPPDSRRR